MNNKKLIFPPEKYWKGMLLDVWAPYQTLNPPSRYVDRYSGYDWITSNVDGIVPRIPLDIRFKNFVSRLDSARARHEARK